MAGTPVVASIYLRISQARDGSTLGVERQLPPALAVCRRNKWRVPAFEVGQTLDDLLEAIRHGRPVEGIYVDNDLSAYDRSKPRKDYQRLLTDIAAGRAGAIAAFDIDRLTRDMREGEDIIDLARTYGTRTAFATGDDYDLSTPGGRYAFRGEVNRAIRESDQKSVRSKAKAAELARAGKFSGYRRPFGYDLEGIPVEGTRPDGTPVTRLIHCRLVINVPEAAEIRAAVKKILTAGSVSAIQTDWNRRGVRRAEGGIWYTRNIVALLTNPRIAGLSRWQDELYEAEWEAIISREDWERVCLILANPAPDPRRGRRGPPPTTYLLTGGLGACECGVSIRGHGTRGVRYYRCEPAQGGCGGIHRLAEPIEDYVRDSVLAAFGDPDRGGRLRRALASMQPDDSQLRTLLTERQALQTRQQTLEQEFIDGYYDGRRQQFESLNDQILAKRERVEAELAALPIATGLPVEIPEGMDAAYAAWDVWTIEERRAVLAFALKRVIFKRKFRGRKFHHSQVALDWRV